MICRNCGAGLEADRIDPSLGVVTCSHCGSLHKIPSDNIPSDSVGRPSGTTAKEPLSKPERLVVGLPSRFKVQQSESSMEVTWPVGRRIHGLVLLVIGGGWGYAALNSGVLPLLIASAGLFYFAAVRAFNTHRIRVDGARLQVTQGPLPWPGTRKLNASDVEQLYATEHKSRVETGDKGHNSNNRVSKHYRLSANMRDSGRVTILSGLNEPHQALWLEQEIERLLGIGDERVAGEYLQ